MGTVDDGSLTNPRPAAVSPSKGRRGAGLAPRRRASVPQSPYTIKLAAQGTVRDSPSQRPFLAPRWVLKPRGASRARLRRPPTRHPAPSPRARTATGPGVRALGEVETAWSLGAALGEEGPLHAEGPTDLCCGGQRIVAPRPRGQTKRATRAPGEG